MNLFWTVAALVLLTYLFGLLEVSHAAKTTLWDAITGTFFVFGLFLLLFNGVAALLVDQVFLQEQLPSELAPWSSFFAVVLGVACFQGVIKHANVTVFTNIPLDFEAWIGKAQDLASEAASQRQLNRREGQAVELAGKLTTMNEADLNAYVDSYLGSGTARQIEKAAEASGADAALFKALTLAKGNPDAARAVVQQIPKG